MSTDKKQLILNHKSLMLCETLYIYCKRHGYDYKTTHINVMLDLDDKKFKVVERMTKDLRNYRRITGYELKEITEQEYDDCVDVFYDDCVDIF